MAPLGEQNAPRYIRARASLDSSHAGLSSYPSHRARGIGPPGPLVGRTCHGGTSSDVRRRRPRRILVDRDARARPRGATARSRAHPRGRGRGRPDLHPRDQRLPVQGIRRGRRGPATEPERGVRHPGPPDLAGRRDPADRDRADRGIRRRHASRPAPTTTDTGAMARGSRSSTPGSISIIRTSSPVSTRVTARTA